MGMAETTWLLLCAAALLALVATTGYRLGRKRFGRGRNRCAQERPEIERPCRWSASSKPLPAGCARRLPTTPRRSANSAIAWRADERTKSLSWHELCDRADEMLKPSLRLTAEISDSYTHLLQQMSHLSTFAELRTDPLTGACNRQALDEALATFLADQTHGSAPLSLAMVDIDFFKQINDSRSLLQGDRVLKELAELLRQTIRQRDVLARYGGEEFVVAMPYTELYNASTLAERIRVAVQDELSITVSIGLAASAHGDTPSTLFSRADSALALAKTAGRNCVYLHEGTSGRIVGFNTQPGPIPQFTGGKTASLATTTVILAPKSPPQADSSATRLAACRDLDA